MELVVTDQGIGRVTPDRAEIELLDLGLPDVGALLFVDESLERARSAPVQRRLPMANVTPRALFGSASRVWGVGLNYTSKARVTGRTPPVVPTLFLKPGAALCGPGDEVPISAASTQVDYEGEVAFVIGRRADGVRAADAWRYVAGITAANDVTARDIMRATGSPLLAKGFDGCSPVGASFRSLDAIPNRDSIGVTTYVNDEVRQRARTDEFLHSVPEIIELISRTCPMVPGDLILTGTPSGTGDDLDLYLHPGDVVRVEVEGILPLSNVMVKARLKPAVTESQTFDEQERP